MCVKYKYIKCIILNVPLILIVNLFIQGGCSPFGDDNNRKIVVKLNEDLNVENSDSEKNNAEKNNAAGSPAPVVSIRKTATVVRSPLVNSTVIPVDVETTVPIIYPVSTVGVVEEATQNNTQDNLTPTSTSIPEIKQTATPAPTITQIIDVTPTVKPTHSPSTTPKDLPTPISIFANLNKAQILTKLSDLCFEKHNKIRAQENLSLHPYFRLTQGESCASKIAQIDYLNNSGHGCLYRSVVECAKPKIPPECDPISVSINEGPFIMYIQGQSELFYGTCTKDYEKFLDYNFNVFMAEKASNGGHYLNFINSGFTHLSCGFYLNDNNEVCASTFNYTWSINNNQWLKIKPGNQPW